MIVCVCERMSVCSHARVCVKESTLMKGKENCLFFSLCIFICLCDKPNYFISLWKFVNYKTVLCSLCLRFQNSQRIKQSNLTGNQLKLVFGLNYELLVSSFEYIALDKETENRVKRN